MALLLEHPKHAALPCEECAKWIYDIKKAEPVLRGGAKQARKPGQPTPCGECPKKSPENARTLALSAANVRTLRLYLRARATQGRHLTDAEARDSLLAKHFATLDILFRRVESRQIGDSLFISMMAVQGVKK